MVGKNMQKSKVKVVDNFLPQNEFDKIKFVLEGSDIPWYWNEESIPGKDNPYYDDTPQLCHTFIIIKINHYSSLLICTTYRSMFC